MTGLHRSARTRLVRDVPEALAEAERRCPGAGLVPVTSGYDNLVVLAGEACALRFPRTPAALLRSRFEGWVLSALHATGTDLPLTAPRVLDMSTDPACMVTTYVPGRSLRLSEAQRFTDDEQARLARSLAAMAFALHGTVAFEDAARERDRLQLDCQPELPWEEHFAKHVRFGGFRNRAQRSWALKCYDEWKAGQRPPTVVVHDDLHLGNLLFEGNTVTGVLDFGDTGLGTPEQDLRHLFRISPTALPVGAQAYEQLSGARVDVDHARRWAIVQELAAYAEKSVEGLRATRAARHLAQWAPDIDW